MNKILTSIILGSTLLTGCASNYFLKSYYINVGGTEITYQTGTVPNTGRELCMATEDKENSYQKLIDYQCDETVETYKTRRQDKTLKTVNKNKNNANWFETTINTQFKELKKKVIKQLED